MRRALTALVVAAGLAAGWASMAVLNRAQTPPRGAQMLALFTQYCLPFAKGQPVVPPEDWVEISPRIGRNILVQPGSALELDLRAGRCEITDLLHPMQDDELDGLLPGLAQLVAAHFPDLIRDDSNELGWDIFTYWHNGQPVGSAQRGGILLSRVPQDQGRHTMLSAALPRDGGPLNPARD